MGMFDFLKGKKKAEPVATKPPSQVLREAGLDPSTLKFGFAADGSITISGTAVSEAERKRIVSVVSDMPGVSGVKSEIELAAVGVETGSTDSAEATMSSDPEPEAPAETPAEEGKTYTVVSGDTLWKIASDHYGKGNEYMKIFEANRDILDNPDKIKVGQVLKIPE